MVVYQPSGNISVQGPEGKKAAQRLAQRRALRIACVVVLDPVIRAPRCRGYPVCRQAACRLIRRYLSGVQGRPDQSATRHDRRPLVRTRPPSA
jgi:hypothetical protein